MLFHWERLKGPHWQFKAAVNAFGTVITGITLVIIVCMKFKSGAWVAILCIAALLFCMSRIKKHYSAVAKELTIGSEEEAAALIKAERSSFPCNPSAARFSKPSTARSAVALKISSCTTSAAMSRKRWS